MEETNPTPVPPAPQPTPTPAPTPAPPAPKKELTPEEKKAKRQAMLKRLGIVGGVTYLVVIVLVVAWAFLGAEKEIGVFDYIPMISQVGFSNFLFTLFNVMWGLLVLGGMVVASIGFIKFQFSKKEEVEKKQKGKKLLIFGGSGFTGLVILWILALAFLGPKLVSEVQSGIITDPVDTFGLTAPIEISFDATYVPIDTSTYEIISYTWNFGDGETANGVNVSHRYTEKGSSDGRYTVTLDVDFMDGSGQQYSQEYSLEVSIDNEQVTADFTATPDSGEVPLSVTFDASESFDPDGEITDYDWDLTGDGRYDDAEGDIVEYEFTQEGSFEVSLRVTDNNGEYDTATMTIEAGSVNGLRAVIATDTKNDLYYVDQKYEFDGSESTVEEGEITTYLWDFGDGDSTQSRTASHTYTETGTYEVVLTVEDSEGNEDESTLEITVTEEGSEPIASFVTTPQSKTGAVPLTVQFDGSYSSDADLDIIQYEWDFDSDGTIDDTGDAVAYTFEEVGTYEVTLTVTDSTGNVDSVTEEIVATAQGITAVLDVDLTNGEVPLTVEFDASGSTYKEGSIVSYEYDFGDGNTHIGGSGLTYKYTGVGTYTASVTVIGDDGSASIDTVQIVVRPVALTACFTVGSDSGSAPLFLTVDATCSEGTISSYSWDFGDGEVSFDRKPETHIYTDPGTYTVTLEITSDDGIVDTFENTITVK